MELYTFDVNGPVKVTVLYKGENLTDKYYNENPDIHNLYPTKSEFNKIYERMYKKAVKTQTQQTLELSENSININGIEKL